jgi:hypothetical protein
MKLEIEGIGDGSGQVRVRWPSTGWATYESIDCAIDAIRAWWARGGEQVALFDAPTEPGAKRAKRDDGQSSLF